MAKTKYYAVKVGKTPGIYLTWEACRSQVDGVSGAAYKSFPTLAEAQAYVGAGADSDFSADAGGGESSGVFAGAGEGSGAAGETGENAGVAAAVPYVRPGRREAEAYVDGSYNAETGEYSCGVVFLTEEGEIHIAEKGESAELASMRNVAGEIMGAELAMKKALELGVRSLRIYHDYQGISSWCLGEWKANKEGTKAYKAYFDSVCGRMDIRFVKVKGHSGDKYNDMADELAKSVIFEREPKDVKKR